MNRLHGALPVALLHAYVRERASREGLTVVRERPRAQSWQATMSRLGPNSKIRILFVDEYSFISQTHLAAMGNRCQQASQNNTDPFGDFHVVLVGDPRQHEAPVSSALLVGAAKEAEVRTTCRAGERERATPYRPAEVEVSEEDEADVGGSPASAKAAAEARRRKLRKASDTTGRAAFLSFSRVINLKEQMRVDDTESGLLLRKHASLFMGNSRSPRGAVEEFCDAFNAKTPTFIDDVLAAAPRVVTQRQKARSTINFNLALRVAAAQGKRASVWLSSHTTTLPNGSTQQTPETMQRVLRANLNVNSVDKLPPALVFFDVRYKILESPLRFLRPVN